MYVLSLCLFLSWVSAFWCSMDCVLFYGVVLFCVAACECFVDTYVCFVCDVLCDVCLVCLFVCVCLCECACLKLHVFVRYACD